MAGTGITAINSLTGAAQTLGTGTSGTDFAISSSGTSHTFNLPTASATNRGALSSANWTTFNSKLGASDTVSLSNRINLKVNIADTSSMLTNYAKTNLVNTKVNISDTATMLSNYQKSATAIKYSDTTSLISTKSNDALKLNISDSSTYYSKYRSDTSRTNIYTAINNKGYGISIGSLLSNFVASTTYYFGITSRTPTTTAAASRIYIPQSGTIRSAILYVKTTIATTSENWTISIRLNNSTSTTLATLGNTSVDKVFQATGLNIAVVAGDYIEIITTTPAWVTGPSNTWTNGTIYIQ
jgi:hypothetical protein